MTTPPSPLTVAEWRAFLSDFNTRHINSDEVREAIEDQRQVISKERLEAGGPAPNRRAKKRSWPPRSGSG